MFCLIIVIKCLWFLDVPCITIGGGGFSLLRKSFSRLRSNWFYVDTEYCGMLSSLFVIMSFKLTVERALVSHTLLSKLVLLVGSSFSLFSFIFLSVATLFCSLFLLSFAFTSLLFVRLFVVSFM